MKAVKLTTANIKGWPSITQPLSGRDIFIGENGSGKSTRLEGFLFALLGYVPGKGKELSDTFKLCSAGEMSGTLETDTGFICTRTIKEKKTKHQDGDKSFSLSQTISVFPPRGEKTDNQKRDRIAAELGDFSIMFNLNALFALSDNEKRKFIFSLTDPAQFGWTKERFLSEIEGANVAFHDLVPKLSLIWDPNGSVQDNVANCLLWVKQQISESKALLKKAQGTKENLLAQKRAIGSDPGSVAELGAEYQKAKDDLVKISEEITQAKERIKFASDLRFKIDSLRKKLSAPEPVMISREDIFAMGENLAKADKEIEKANREREKAETEAADLFKQMKELEVPIRNLTAQGLACKDVLTKIAASKGLCPLIGKKCKANLNDFTAERTTELEQMRKEMTKLKKQNDDLAEKQVAAEKRIKEITRAIETMHVTKLSGQRTLDSLVKNNELAQKDTEARNGLKKQIEDAEAELKNLNIVDINPMESVRQGLAGQIRNLEMEIDKRKTIATMLGAFDRANIEAVELEQKVDLLEDLATALGPVNLQGKILKDTIGPLIGKINNLLQMTGRDYNLKPILTDKNGKEIFDFVWEKHGSEISFESLSGGEKVVFGAALATALVLQKNPPLKTLIVEASECDEKNLVAMMDALDKFGGDINNVLIATHIMPSVTAPSWQSHKLHLS